MAMPYCGAAPLPAEIWSHWNLDPVLIAAMALSLWLARRHWSPALWAGYAVLALAFLSPLCALSSGLFAARSAHHLLLVAVAAPLLAHAGIGWRRMSLPGAAGLHILVFWAWHAPALYAHALSNDGVYWAMQLSLLGTAILFWSAAFRSRSLSAQVAALIAMIGQMGLLGALITFAPDPLYAPHLLTTRLYGLSPLDDQQLAGLIMWVASLPLYVAAALPALARRLQPPGREAAA
jgi:putative membrane protein